jgi:hypothetical protein
MRLHGLIGAVVFTSALGLPRAAGAGGGYISGGLGGGADLGGELDAFFTTEEQGSMRLSLGQRVGPVALEASLMHAGLVGQRSYVGMDADYAALSGGIDLKFFVGLAGPLELYGKGGLDRTWLMAPSGSPHDHDGSGWDLGAGLQFTIDTPAAMFAVWLDFTHLRTTLRNPGSRDLDGRLNTLSLGVSLGF